MPDSFYITPASVLQSMRAKCDGGFSGKQEAEQEAEQKQEGNQPEEGV
jgi:hypothetical protein